MAVGTKGGLGKINVEIDNRAPKIIRVHMQLEAQDSYKLICDDHLTG